MKINKFMIATLMISTSPLALSTEANAAEAGSKDSDAIVKFHADNSTENPKDPNDGEDDITPMDPEDPTKPIDPEGTAGPLSIDFVSRFYFGDNLISLSDQTYNAAAQSIKKNGATVEVPNYVQVTDKRGTLSGWSLAVKQDGQFKSQAINAGTELTGAQISFENGNLFSKSTSTKPSNVKAMFKLDPNGAEQTIVSAASGEGAGQWFYRFGEGDANGSTPAAIVGNGNESVKLFVPGSSNALADTYKTKLIWTLKDVPDANFE